MIWHSCGTALALEFCDSATWAYGQADEIAGMVAYLASPEAAFVTGASLTIDGGYNA